MYDVIVRLQSFNNQFFLKMNVEENNGSQPQPQQNVPVGQPERMDSQMQNQGRRPINRESGKRNSPTNGLNRGPTGRRPRIKESQRINYDRSVMNRQDEGNRVGVANRQRYVPSQDMRDRRIPQVHTPLRQGDDFGNTKERTNVERGGREKPRIGSNATNRPMHTPGKSASPKNATKKPRNTGDYNPNAKYSGRKQLKYKEDLSDPNEPIRLNRFLANAGVCSRREADKYIQAGVVKVNDVIITELGTKISRMDTVMFHNQPVKIESKIYIVLNKPKNCVTSTDDPEERLTVMNLVKNACRERIYPVGRLDRNTTGLLLLTNDGHLASKLTHPSFKKKKIYHVWLDKEVAIEDMEKIANGIELEDGEIHADAISYVNDEAKNQVGIEIHSGRNRIVRRMFEALGYRVTKLDRVYYAGLTKKNLPRGKWRYLNEMEVNALRIGSFE